MYSNFSNAFHPRYRCRHSSGVAPNQTAKVSAKSSSGCDCAYQFGKWRTKLRLYGCGFYVLGGESASRLPKMARQALREEKREAGSMGGPHSARGSIS